MEKIQELMFQGDTFEGDTIRCDVCKNFLSVSPILHNDSLGSICGRENCSKIANSTGTNYRQRAYEALARYLTFPCMYKNNGCSEQLFWDQVAAHEEMCKFVTSSCPFSSDRFKHLENEVCAWKGDTSTLLEHLEKEHDSTHKFENNVQFDLENVTENNNVFFSNIKDSIVIILVIVDQKSCAHFNVWSGHAIWRNLNYKIGISTQEEQYEPFSKLQTPELIYPAFFESEVNNNWFKIDPCYLRKIFDYPDSLKIEFCYDGFLIGAPQRLQNETMMLLKANGQSNKKDEESCDNCNGKIVDSYFECTSGQKHVICSKCRSKRSPCNLCGFSLFPKQISASGLMKLSSIIDKSFKHCLSCSELIDCFSSHIYNCHSDIIWELDQFYPLSLSTRRLDSTRYISFHGHIFPLSIHLDHNNISFSVQCLETKAIKYKYEFTLQVSEKSPHYGSMTYSRFCIPEYIDVSKIPDSIYIPLNWLNDFVPYESGIFAKVRISKI